MLMVREWRLRLRLDVVKIYRRKSPSFGFLGGLMFKYAVDLFKKLKICIIPCIIAFVGIVGYCAKQIFTNINTTEVLYGERVVLNFL